MTSDESERPLVRKKPTSTTIQDSYRLPNAKSLIESTQPKGKKRRISQPKRSATQINDSSSKRLSYAEEVIEQVSDEDREDTPLSRRGCTITYKDEDLLTTVQSVPRIESIRGSILGDG